MSLSPFRAVLAAAIVSSSAAFPAAAHVVAHPDEGVAGGYFRAAFAVTHGCKGSPTVAVTIRIPAGVLSAKPQPKPGWTIDIVTRPVDPPVDTGHGFVIRQTAAEVTWRGGPLANAHFDDFTLSMRLPATPGETLYFPVIQTCATGSNDWVEIPAAGQRWHDLHEPAPFVRLRPR